MYIDIFTTDTGTNVRVLCLLTQFTVYYKSVFYFISLSDTLSKEQTSFENLPPVLGMLSYREDNKKLYVNKGNEWDAIGSEKEVSFDVSF